MSPVVCVFPLECVFASAGLCCAVMYGVVGYGLGERRRLHRHHHTILLVHHDDLDGPLFRRHVDPDRRATMLSLRAAARRSIGASTSTPSSRLIHTQTVTDDDIARLAAQPLHALTLADLCQHGRPPLSPAALLRSAHFTLALLPARLAHRIQALRRLPYIVVANPHVHRIHAHYVHSLSTLLPYAEPREDGGADGGGSGRLVTSADELRFTDVMADLVRTHAHTIAVLAKGFLEARRYIRADEVTRFLDEHLRARIGTRLIAE